MAGVWQSASEPWQRDIPHKGPLKASVLFSQSPASTFFAFWLAACGDAAGRFMITCPRWRGRLHTGPLNSSLPQDHFLSLFLSLQKVLINVYMYIANSDSLQLWSLSLLHAGACHAPADRCGLKLTGITILWRIMGTYDSSLHNW